jgi:hypothetical protein
LVSGAPAGRAAVAAELDSSTQTIVVAASDRVQPRAETPIYIMRRTTVVERYGAGSPSATQYLSSDAAKISDLGK